MYVCYGWMDFLLIECLRLPPLSDPISPSKICSNLKIKIIIIMLSSSSGRSSGGGSSSSSIV